MYSPWYPVTPCMGVWIENGIISCPSSSAYKSLPVWECGLKILLLCGGLYLIPVTPCMGVWIENWYDVIRTPASLSHSLYGSVD